MDKMIFVIRNSAVLAAVLGIIMCSPALQAQSVKTDTEPIRHAIVLVDAAGSFRKLPGDKAQLENRRRRLTPTEVLRCRRI